MAELAGADMSRKLHSSSPDESPTASLVGMINSEHDVKMSSMDFDRNVIGSIDYRERDGRME